MIHIGEVSEPVDERDLGSRAERRGGANPPFPPLAAPHQPGGPAPRAGAAEGAALAKMAEEEVRHIRGNKSAMIFQEPMTSLNPVLTIGRQLTETLELHLGMNGETARTRAIELLSLVGIPS